MHHSFHHYDRGDRERQVRHVVLAPGCSPYKIGDRVRVVELNPHDKQERTYTGVLVRLTSVGGTNIVVISEDPDQPSGYVSAWDLLSIETIGDAAADRHARLVAMAALERDRAIRARGSLSEDTGNKHVRRARQEIKQAENRLQRLVRRQLRFWEW